MTHIINKMAIEKRKPIKHKLFNFSNMFAYSTVPFF